MRDGAVRLVPDCAALHPGYDGYDGYDGLQ
jgi:hypothetical protein